MKKLFLAGVTILTLVAAPAFADTNGRHHDGDNRSAGHSDRRGGHDQRADSSRRNGSWDRGDNRGHQERYYAPRHRSYGYSYPPSYYPNYSYGYGYDPYAYYGAYPYDNFSLGFSFGR